MISAEEKTEGSDTSDSESSDEEKTEDNPIKGELGILSCKVRNENMKLHSCMHRKI